MSPRVHSNLYEGFPQAFQLQQSPLTALGVLPYTKFSRDANIYPDICLLAMQISECLNVNAKVLSSEEAHWHLGLRALFDYLDSSLLFFLRFIILDSLWEPEHRTISPWTEHWRP